MNLKRDNWTNQEVIDIILGLVPVQENGEEFTLLKDYALGLKNAAEHFRSHFQCKEDSYSALALDTDTGIVYHVGKMLPQ